MNLTKNNIAKKISNNLPISNQEGMKLINKLIDLIKENTIKGTKVKINNFGTYYQKLSPKRLGRNPMTGKSYIINPRKKIAFLASSKIREYLN